MTEGWYEGQRSRRPVSGARRERIEVEGTG
jgi:hypothetical protein